MLGVSVILSAVCKFRTWQIGGWEEITEGKGEERAVHRVTERRNDIGGEKGEKENHRRARAVAFCLPTTMSNDDDGDGEGQLHSTPSCLAQTHPLDSSVAFPLPMCH